jgi:hypothetical protein
MIKSTTIDQESAKDIEKNKLMGEILIYMAMLYKMLIIWLPIVFGDIKTIFFLI